MTYKNQHVSTLHRSRILRSHPASDRSIRALVCRMLTVGESDEGRGKTHSDRKSMGSLKNKPQMNADERRLIATAIENMHRKLVISVNYYILTIKSRAPPSPMQSQSHYISFLKRKLSYPYSSAIL